MQYQNIPDAFSRILKIPRQYRIYTIDKFDIIELRLFSIEKIPPLGSLYVYY